VRSAELRLRQEGMSKGQFAEELAAVANN
jgi:hypothetical protein